MSKDDTAEIRTGTDHSTVRLQTLTMQDAMFKARSAGLLGTGGLPNDQEKWKAESAGNGNVVLRRIIDLQPNGITKSRTHFVKEIQFLEVKSRVANSSGSARFVREVHDAQGQVTASDVIDATIENSILSHVHYVSASAGPDARFVDVSLTFDRYGRATYVERWKKGAQGEDRIKQAVRIRYETESLNAMKVYDFEGIPKREFAADEHYYDLPEYKFLSAVNKDTGCPIELDLTDRYRGVDTQASLGALIKVNPALTPVLKSTGEGLRLSHFLVPRTLPQEII